MKKTILLGGLFLMTACSSMTNNTSHRFLDIQAQWIRQIDSKLSYDHDKISRFTPIIYKDTVIAGGTQGGIAAFTRKQGVLKWRFPVEHGVESSGVLYNNNRIIFGAKDGYIYSINADNGELVWKFFAKAEVLGDISLDAGDIYVLSGANVLYKLDADDGKQRWVYSRVQRSRFSVRGGAKVLVKNNRVYAGFSDGFLVALNKEEGSLLWERRLGKGGRLEDVDTSPVALGNKLFVASYDGALYALSANDGGILWRVDKGGFSAPVVSDNSKLLFPTSERELLVIDANSGKIEHTMTLKSLAASPKIVSNMWIVPQVQGSALIYDSITKAKIGSYDPGKGSLAEVSWDEENKQFYLNSNAGNLHAVKSLWGDKRARWSWQQ